MRPDIARKWTALLRSDQYEQGRDALQIHGKFCCLGVLCDLHRQEVGGQWSDHPREGYSAPSGSVVYQPAGGDEWDYALLPEAVMRWAGIASFNPCTDSHNLTALNDDGWSFGQIADLIDDHWGEL